jgi:hypothetical protein
MKLLTGQHSTPKILNNTLHHRLPNKMHLAISTIQGMSTKRIKVTETERVGTNTVTYSLGNKLTAKTLTVRSMNFKQIQHTQSLKSEMVKKE